MYNPKLKNKDTDELFHAILKLETIDECYQFFEDICTISELRALTQRLLVAKLLKQDTPFNTIVKETGASSATVSRVKRCLLYGADGYNLILERIEQSES